MYYSTRRKILKTSFGLAGAYAVPAMAQDNYPSRPVNLIVTYPPGGQNDLTARIVAQPFSSYWGQQLIVENKAGAGGVIGAQIVAKSTPDGYTLMLIAINHILLSILKSDVRYDPEKDFTAVAMIAAFPIVLAVNPNLPIHSVGEFIKYAKDNPGKLAFGSATGSGGHLAAELFAARTGIKMLFVPYKGDAPAMTDLIGGQISCMFVSVSSAMSFITSNKIRPLGISTIQRSELLPDLPTISEGGVQGYEANSWVGIVGPAGISSDIVNKINLNVNRALEDGSIREKILQGGGQPQPGTAADFQKFIHAEKEKWTGVIKQANIHID